MLFRSFMNKALNYVVLNELDSSLKYVDYAQKLIPGSQNAFGFKKSLSEKFTLHGIELFEKGNKIEGLKSLSNALKANKNNYRAWNNMGKALTIIGDLEKATLCFRSALQIEPKNSISIKGITVIDSLKQITIGRVSKK